MKSSMLWTGLAFVVSARTACASDQFILATKVTPSYWRATFSSTPLEVQGLSFFEDYYALIDRIAADQNVKVVVFDSSSPYYWLNHYDVVNNVPFNLSWATYWGNLTRLANLPVLTVAAIRGHTSGGGAEIAASLDVRFGSREKAVYTQPEVGLGKAFHHNKL
jgi:enoyl-CoA hydratase/carnithine racemase